MVQVHIQKSRPFRYSAWFWTTFSNLTCWRASIFWKRRSCLALYCRISCLGFVCTCQQVFPHILSHFILYLMLYSPIMDSEKNRGSESRNHHTLSIVENVEMLRLLYIDVTVKTMILATICYLATFWGSNA